MENLLPLLPETINKALDSAFQIAEKIGDNSISKKAMECERDIAVAKIKTQKSIGVSLVLSVTIVSVAVLKSKKNTSKQEVEQE